MNGGVCSEGACVWQAVDKGWAYMAGGGACVANAFLLLLIFLNHVYLTRFFNC